LRVISKTNKTTEVYTKVKKALILNAGMEGATRVFVGGKVKEGFNGTITLEGNKFTLGFPDGPVTVDSLETDDVTRWKTGKFITNLAYGNPRSILSIGSEGVVLGGKSGRPLKNPERATFAELAQNYIPTELASAMGVAAGDDGE
jgi:hypothetical protein